MNTKDENDDEMIRWRGNFGLGDVDCEKKRKLNDYWKTWIQFRKMKGDKYEDKEDERRMRKKQVQMPGDEKKEDEL